MDNIRKGLTFKDVLLIPQKSVLTSRKEAQLDTYITQNIVLSTPLISANMATVTETAMAQVMATNGGIGIIHRFCSTQKQMEMVSKVKDTPVKVPYAATDEEERLRTGAAIGVNDGIQRAEYLRNAGADILVLDVAHAHANHVLEHVKHLKRAFPDQDILVGNIGTAMAAEDIIAAGADGVKVGVGPSPVCTTRDVAGAGVPQLTAIMDVVSVAKEENIPVCADGGMRTSGDIVKALAAGASTIMSGTIFAGTDESPGKVVHDNDQSYKVYQGSASADNKRQWQMQEENTDTSANYVEGTTTYIPCQGPASSLIDKLCQGIQSGISYCGGHDMQTMQRNAEFIQT